MANFKEMLEAKKKAEAAKATVQETAKEVIDLTGAVIAKDAAKEITAPKVGFITPTGEKKSFAEIMAEKKAMASAGNAAVATTIVPVIADKQEEAPKVLAPVESVQSGASQLATIPAKEDTGTASVDDPVLAQAYADIKGKIEALEALEDTDLSGAMSELKKALMQNPNAVSLMLDTDIGKMVIALRRITKEAQIEQAKEKTGGRKPKASKLLPVSAEALSAVFDEL